MVATPGAVVTLGAVAALGAVATLGTVSIPGNVVACGAVVGGRGIYMLVVLVGAGASWRVEKIAQRLLMASSWSSVLVGV